MVCNVMHESFEKRMFSFVYTSTGAIKQLACRMCLPKRFEDLDDDDRLWDPCGEHDFITVET